MEDQSVQLSLEHVESLVHRLYQQTSPGIIAATQASLSSFQDSQQAWRLIPGLLERPDEKVKFFGALTIIIKLNKESSSLHDTDAIELLNRLIGWLMDSLDHSTGHLVPRKLASAMATFFLHFHRLWPLFLRHLVVCLASHQLIDPNAADESLSIVATSLDGLQPRQLRAALWIMTNVVEDVSRMELNTTNKDLFDDMMRNVPDAVALMAKGLSTLSAVPDVHGDSTRCFQSLIHLAMKSLQADSHIVNCLKPLAEVVIESITVDNLFDTSAELLVDIIVNNPSLLNQDQYVLLARLFEAPWAQERYKKLLQGDFAFESMKFGQLILAFGENKTETLMRSVDDSSQQILFALCELLTAEGYPVLEDKVFVSVVEFWSSFVEALTDLRQPQPGEPSPPWVPLAISHVSKAASNAWRKIIYPPHEIFCQWGSSDRIGFNDARNDVIDLMQSTYTIIGPTIAENFAKLILSALENSAWLPLEAAAFCLGGLADCSKGDSQFDEALNAVFTSPLFSVLCAESSSVPLRTQQSCFALIERYSEYFERNVGLLTPVLDMLFAMLHDHCMATSASKAVLRLCSSYRHLLHTAATEFILEYEKLVHGKHLNCITSERVIGAISSVAQAIPVACERYDACIRILEFVQSDVETTRKLSTLSSTGITPSCQSLKCFGTGEAPAMHMGLRALRCLVSVGKAFQSPLKPTIKVEDERESCRILPFNEQLVSLHERILRLVSEFQSLMGANSETTELISSLLRCGFSENDPGPFVFQPNMVARFLTNHTERNPRICLLVSTACSFVSSMHSKGYLETQEIIATLLLWVIGLLKQLPGPEYDPELSQNGLEFSTRILARTPSIVLDLRPTKSAEFLFMFAIQVLDGHEPLPKGAAAEFWATFVGLRDGDSQVQHLTQQAMNTLGPLLSQSLARNLGGNASRSELDKLSEPVKKLVSRHPMAREWLQNGLDHSSFPSTKVNAEQKALFVKKLISLRGSRATNQVIREFWLCARGSSFTYTS